MYLFGVNSWGVVGIFLKNLSALCPGKRAFFFPTPLKEKVIA